MEPIRAEKFERILQKNPEASRADIQQYQQLLAQRFEQDPDLVRDPAEQALVEQREEHLKELYNKLFVVTGERQDGADEENSKEGMGYAGSAQ